MNRKDIDNLKFMGDSLMGMVNKMQKDLQENLLTLDVEKRKDFAFDFEELKKEAEQKSKELIANCELLKTKLKSI